jgi:hypothetical protein
VSIDPIETQLDVLESVGLVELYQTEPELEYLFRHVLIQEAAYASMGALRATPIAPPRG